MLMTQCSGELARDKQDENACCLTEECSRSPGSLPQPFAPGIFAQILAAARVRAEFSRDARVTHRIAAGWVGERVGFVNDRAATAFGGGPQGRH